MKTRGGFTLVEVLVALAVLAIALAAVLRLSAAGTANIDLLRQRALAGWVAENRVSEVLLAPGLPETGMSQGVAEMAGGRWRWTLTVSRTSDRGLRRLDVDVAYAGAAVAGRPAPLNPAPGPVLVSLSAFKGGEP